MTFVPQIPKKVQFIFDFSFPLVRKLCRKTFSEQFVGGRKGYDKGYDDGDLVDWVVKMLSVKAGIPIKKHKRGKNYSWIGSWRNFQRKAKGRSIKKSIYNKRTAIERTFSMLKRVYHLGKEETRGILAFAKNVYLALICYMLKLFDIVKTS